MRFVIVMLLVGLCGCAVAEDGTGGWDEVNYDDPLPPSPAPGCRMGCPVGQSKGGQPWPWAGNTVQPLSDTLDDSVTHSPVPCFRWLEWEFGGPLSAELIAVGNGGSPIPPGPAERKLDLAIRDRIIQPVCNWDRRSGDFRLIERIRKSVATNEVRLLEGALYHSTPQGGPDVVDGFLAPSAYWKVISVLSGSSLHTVSLIIPYGTSPEDGLCPYIVTIDEVEEASGLDLFPQAEDDAFEATKGDLAGAIGC